MDSSQESPTSKANEPEEEVDIHREELEKPPVEKPVETIPEDQLKEDAAKRSKKQPMVTRIVRALRKEKKDFAELVINSEPLETRVALLRNGVLEKFEVERQGDDRMVGTIYKGKIQNLEPGLKAAFVDIGEPKNAFLHYWDILPAANDNTIEIVRDNKNKEKDGKGGEKQPEKITVKDIPKKYPVGSEIVVQVTKATIGSKGPRTTTNIALPGRFIVLMPFSGQCGISRKIADKGERGRLKKILRDLTIPEGMGVIMRTAGEGKKARYFVRDLHLLLRKWEEIQEKIASSKKPVCLYREPDLVERTVRDFLTEDIDRVIIDDPEDHQRMLGLVGQISSRSKAKIAIFKENIPIFERFNVERQIEQTFMRKVPLPSGGEIVIEETEALVSVDVNTGGHKGGSKDGKDFIVRANLEAAAEVARQIRLRNIGGLIIIDFIDMKQKRDRNAVYQKMRQEMSRDAAKSHVLPISQLGLLQMSRQRHKESHSSGIYTSCPYCSGRGIVKSARSISVEIQRRIVSVSRHSRSSGASEEPLFLRILLHPVNLERLRAEDEAHLIELEKSYNVNLSFRADPSYHVENFKILDGKTGRELR
ncbi:Rne/Rng family ribonuclease [Puniceicoccus vermicola]|uniref:Rne/Rng family ribonuclease n=1 Tax=Puniceicoccus vermicola TaxID=388746 RepID=A0A7X1AV08_9BACT|nr:Rne/Rng family ribonuclease [Puniceicoccus vermicola]MBC2600374.1 Rne/Rng family ribonuclease [Puniceicoccus vermicola]